ncbi:MAG TPA: hypothetical protein VFM55_26065 [Micromonosporaceae bacterium]|nr:hypothetical protein [Micromonosporaceae bacterium]
MRLGLVRVILGVGLTLGAPALGIGLSPAPVGATVPALAVPALAVPVLAAPVAQAPAPTPGATGRGAPAGKVLCTITDPRLVELSGLAATADGYVAVNDSSDRLERKRIFFLNKSCQVTDAKRYSGGGPRDTEDLAVGADGTIWVADTGDTQGNPVRETIGLWKLVPGADAATLFRLSYPDKPHDAEALLLGANDSPVIVTKDGAVSGIYVPAGPLAAGRTTPTRKVGEFKPHRTGTSTPLAAVGQVLVTGGANAPDRRKVVLRTYSDAYEWDVPDGDVVKAITTGKPRITPLPDEPWGEAIAYSPDGGHYLTVSETIDQPATVKPEIRQYVPAPVAAGSPGAGLSAKKNTLAWYEELSLRQLTMLISGIGVLGLVLVVVGVLGIRKARSSPPRGEDSRGRRSTDDDQPTELLAPVLDGHADAGYSGYGEEAGWYDGYGAPARPGTAGSGRYPDGGYASGYGDYGSASGYQPRR